MLDYNIALDTVREFANVMLNEGRIVSCSKPGHLFAGQLNVNTHRVPKCTSIDPGVHGNNRELAGTGPHCQNLLFEIELLDMLGALSEVTGDSSYSSAADEHLGYVLSNCRHPKSGYILWGEHVGYNLVKAEMQIGGYKGWHEVKGLSIPWEKFWEINPESTRYEIEVAFQNHICDWETMAFNRHADMEGNPNTSIGPCSLACSGGMYISGWLFLYNKTGVQKFYDLTCKMNAFYKERTNPFTGLFPTSEDRPDELWYADVLGYAFLISKASGYLPDSDSLRDELTSEACEYTLNYCKAAYDAKADCFRDTLNVATGKPVIGVSGYCPEGADESTTAAYTRPSCLYAWKNPENSMTLVSTFTSLAGIYCNTKCDVLSTMDKVLELLDIPGLVSSDRSVISGDLAGVILGLVNVWKLSGMRENYLDLAASLVEYAIRKNYVNGLFTSGLLGSEDYYSIRTGSPALASAVLAYAIAAGNIDTTQPVIRNPWGVMPW